MTNKFIFVLLKTTMVTWESLQKYAANGVLSNTKTEHTQKRARDDLRKSQAELVAVH